MNAVIETIKQLREETGAGVMECRKALEQGNQNYANALSYLRQKAAIRANKQSDREAREGKIELYSHGNGRIGVMVEINTESEFASRSEIFQRFAHEIALQITSASPLYVRDEDIPVQVMDEQAQAATAKALQAGKPERVIQQIADGVLEKFKDKSVLLRQSYIRDESITVAQLLNQAISQIGENIVIRRFARWEVCPDAETSPPQHRGSPA